MPERRGILGRAYTLTRVGGVDIRIDISWLAIAALIVWSFWARFNAEDEVATVAAIAMAVVGALLFFSSVLAHELAHALEARHRGVEIAGITLFLFGGVTESKFDVKRPRDEFALTAVGPFTSFVLAAVFGLVATWTDPVQEVALVAGFLGWINLALGVFNLLPGAPLDGGRILRSIAWWITGDRLRSIRIASGTGWLVAAGIMGLGFLQLFVPGGFVGGLWFLFIGWFLMQGATAEWQQAKLREALADVPVSRLVDRQIAAIPADTSVEDAVEEWIRVRDPDLFPVVEADRLVGVIGVDEVRRLDPSRWPEVAVRDVMTPVDELPTVEESRSAGEALEDLVGPGRVVIATEDGRPDGLITTQRLAMVAQRSMDLRPGRRGSSGAGRTGGPDGRAGDGQATPEERVGA